MSYEDPTPPRDAFEDEFLGVAVICLAVGALLGVAFTGVLQSLTPAAAAPPGPAIASLTALTRTKDFLASLQSVAAIGAILGGAFWFYRRRARYPRLVWAHAITHERLNDHTIWLHVQTTVENKGEVRIGMPGATTRILQVLPTCEDLPAQLLTPEDIPFHEGEICWPVIGECIASPGRLDVEPTEVTTFERDFLIPAEVEVVVVYTFIPNQARSATGHGWPVQTVYRIAPPQPTEDT